MSSFTTPLIVTPLDDKLGYWQLVEEFLYYIGTPEKKEYVIMIPKGYETNFASIPRAFWPILPPYGKYGKAAVVHDYCYSQGLFTRKKCDIIFKEAMRVLKVPSWQIYTIYYAVRLFGENHYHGKEKTNNDSVYQ